MYYSKYKYELFVIVIF